MPLFRRRRPSGLTPDNTLGNPTARQALQAAATGWPALVEVLRPTDSDDRELAVSVVTEEPGWPRWVDDWVAAQPDEPLAWTVRGAKGVHWGWQARGGATDVDGDAWIEFQRRLGGADEDLARGAALDPTDPTPHCFRLIAARGLELGLDVIRERFDEVTELEPLHRAAHNHMIQALAPKWGGSNDAMFEFARHVTATAPEGSAVHVVIAEAHIERWLWTLVGDQADSDAANRYWSRPGVRDEVVEAAERSVLSPHYQRTARYPWDHQLYAFAFWMTDRYDLAATMFERVGDVVSEFPWIYKGDPGQVFESVRAQVTAPQ